MTHPLVAVPPTVAGIVHTPCQVRLVRWIQPTLPCARCGGQAARVWDVGRTAIDLVLEAPVLLQVEVSVHACRTCHRHFRAQPPFLRPDAIYTNRIVAKALDAMYQVGLAFRRVPDRLARDFWVRPSEATVRAWCRLSRGQAAAQDDYLPWVVQACSGILCLDEVYQGDLGVLLAVDPATPAGDRLVGYQLVNGTVDSAAVTAFLCRLKEAGIHPDEVITDGLALYPGVLAAVWPAAAHQLCLFHESRHVTEAVLAVISQARRSLPTPPPRSRQGRGGPLTPAPPTRHVNDPATQQWHLRRARRSAELREVHDLVQQGYSQRAIATLTGRHRRTVRACLAQAVPDLSEETQALAARVAADGADTVLRRRRRTPDRLQRVQGLASAASPTRRLPA